MTVSGYETADARAPRVFLWAVALAATIGLVFALCRAAFLRLEPGRAAPAVSAAPMRPSLYAPAAPRLQVDPEADLLELRRQEEKLLTTYGWADREAGEVRVPIDRAIELLLRERPPREGRR